MFGKARHIVVRSSQSPLTNLHLGNARGDVDAFRAADQPHANLCSGRGRCGTCAVRVVSSDFELPEPSPLERATLDRIGRGSDTRLACQLRLLGGGAIEVAAIYPADYSFSDSEPGQDETGGAIEATQ